MILRMVTVLRAHGFAVRIYKDDHPPAHVHVIGDGEVKLDLVTLAILYQRGATKREVSRAIALVKEHRETLLAEWRKIHG